MQALSQILTILLVMSSISDAFPNQEEDLAAFKNAYLQYEKYFTEGNLRESLPQARLAYELGLPLLGGDSYEACKLAYNYGNNLVQLRRFKEALPKMTEALDCLETNQGADSIELAPVLMDLGHVDANINRGKTRMKLYNRAFKLYERNYGDDSIEFAWFSVKAGKDMMYLARDRQGAKHLKTGFEILWSKLGEQDSKTGYAAYHLGKHEISSKRYKAAKRYLLIALASFDNPDKPSSTIELSTHAFLVLVYEELGEGDLATQHSLAIGRMTPFESTQEYFPLYKKPAVYPKSALHQRNEGYVVVQFTVDENGFVREPRVIRVEGDKAFERPALDAVKTFRYAPRFVDGEAVAVKGVQNKITFSINK